LAGDPLVSGSSEAVIAVVLAGRAGMPAYREELSAAKIAAILSYVRSAWGNSASPVSAVAVEAVKAGGSDIAHPKSNLPYGGRLPD
jgi:cytochrome c6